MSIREEVWETTVAVIIAGGHAHRMGGGDKTLRLLAGHPLVSYVWTIIAPQVRQVALNINGSPRRFAAILPRAPVLADAKTDQGPLAGVLAGLHWAIQSRAARLLTVPSDTPFLPRDLVARLTHAAAVHGATAACACSAGHQHPLVGIWDISLAIPLTAFLDAGNHTVKKFLCLCQLVMVDFPTSPLDPFTNVNTPDDLIAAERVIQKQFPPSH